MKVALREPYKQFFGTLSNQCRLEIIEVLMDGPKNVTEITKLTNCEQSAISHGLKRLETCGFVRSKRNGKEKIYELNKETIKPLMNLMHKHMENYCERLC